MSGFIRKLENIYAAAAFGECGEWETARDIAKDESPYISGQRPGTGVRKGSPTKSKTDEGTTPRPRVAG